MNNDLSSAARCFGLYDGDKIVGFCGVMHQPHGVTKNLKRVTRIVILPDYQGIGLGTRFLNVIAKYYTDQGYVFSIVTSAKNMIHALERSPEWKCARYGVNRCQSKKSAIDYARTTVRNNCKTASFVYKGR